MNITKRLLRVFQGTKVLVAFAAAVLDGCTLGGASVSVTQGSVIRDVTVVNTRDGSLAPHMAVVLDGGKITRVAPTERVAVGGTATVVDGSGKYLVPGFLDMHTHAMPMADLPSPPWPLLLANGITGIREMAGSPELIARAHKLNADSAAGRVEAPEVLAIPGPLIFAPMPAAAAVQNVQQQKAMGADFIKLINANHDATMAVLAEAARQGLTVSGHLPIGVTTEEVSNAGWRSIEHLGAGMGVPLDCSTDEPAIRGAMLSGAGAKPSLSPMAVVSPLLFRGADAPFYQRIVDTYSADKCRALADVLVENETWQVPTLIRLRGMQFSDDAGIRSDPDLVYVDKTTHALWEKLAAQYTAEVSPANAESFRAYYRLQKQVVALFGLRGVKMLAGSDLGGIWVVPGFSLHQEFHELASVGLSPLQILQMTTWNGAQFLHREATMGTVDEGKTADLVLLDANPLLDVSNLDRISAVFVKGRYRSSDDLRKMKDDVGKAYAAQPLRDLTAVIDKSHVD